MPRHETAGLSTSSVVFPRARRRWHGLRRAESPMKNHGLRALPGPTGDLACPRNKLVSCSVTGVLELLIVHSPMAVKWGTRVAAQRHLGTC